MPMQNPVKGRVQGWLGGLLAGPLAWGVGGAGPVGMVLGIFAMTGAVLLYCVHEYQLIVIANQEMHAASFDAQSVLAANHLTPEQAASNLARGVVINGLDGKPIVGKSLETFTAYLAGQAKATAEIAAASFDSQGVLAANHLTPEQAASNLTRGVVINGLDGKPIVGKSLEAFTAYLTRQAKATAEIAKAFQEAISTMTQTATNCWETVKRLEGNPNTENQVRAGCRELAPTQEKIRSLKAKWGAID